jgi:hypothetical protein
MCISPATSAASPHGATICRPSSPAARCLLGMVVAGAANGAMTLAAALREGQAQAEAQLSELGLKPRKTDLPEAEDEPREGAAFWYVTESRHRAWLDLQNDVTVKDVKLAHQEGFRSVEHLKRYTTLGMATDQGKTANIPALAIMAGITGKTIPETGTTIFRPPYTPIPMGALAGRSRGEGFPPHAPDPLAHWATANGASFVTVGNWLRARMVCAAGRERLARFGGSRGAHDARKRRHLRCDHAGQDRPQGPRCRGHSSTRSMPTPSPR